MNKGKFNRYNDGIVSIYRDKPKNTDFNAKQNASALDDLEFVVKLNYEEASRREQDNEFALQMDFSLSLKVRTRLYAKVDNKCKAVIDGYLFAVQYVDKTRDEMYLYLEGVRSLVTE